MPLNVPSMRPVTDQEAGLRMSKFPVTPSIIEYKYWMEYAHYMVCFSDTNKTITESTLLK